MTPFQLVSIALPRFWQMYRVLPSNIRRRARRAFQRFLANPAHPGLEFKRLQGRPDYWSARVTGSHRAVCRRVDDTLYWWWIGTHAEFDRDFA